MNYKLIEEMLSLKEKGNNNAQIADAIGSNKTIVTIALRVHSITEAYFKEALEKLSESNTKLLEEAKYLRALNALCEQQITELRSLDATLLLQKNKKLSSEIKENEKLIEKLEDHIYSLENESLLQIIKRRFLRGV